MGQKTNPIGNRLGIIRGWESNWYGGNDYGDKLAEDDKIRKYVQTRLSKASVAHVIIERTFNLVTVTITTARTWYHHRERWSGSRQAKRRAKENHW